MPISVTFDSNTWEIVVDEEKRNESDQIYQRIYELIRTGEISPFFFEGLATMETVRKRDRKSHMAEYKAGFEMSVDGKIYTKSTGSGAPEISDYLKKMIPKALELGFRFTHLPRIGAPMLKIPDKYWAPDEKYCMGERQTRSFECAGFIESLGSGKAALLNELEAGHGGVVQRTLFDQAVTKKKYAKLFAEWVDGDALAVSYGYGIDYFCTNDTGSGAGSFSIFYPKNLAQLEAKYPVSVVSPAELVGTVQAGCS
ncbi:MAG: hypothetical protein HLUCCX14_14165 [Marinobacter excellens HL-55]|uniref:Uncharacterized protein n=1 Tax=Marinobacter excellens HL-55 TaxID=1305731 RepID=A0A0N8KKB2_9GAMM|nr:MAG: hypothetical protein HLUCCX14_14165 [Marinobacter excellens HL-55]